MAATGYGTVVYNGKRIIPGPYVTATKEYKRSEDGKKLSAQITFTLNGTLVACRGSAGTYTGGDYPADDTGCCKFEDILNKQDELRTLFDTDYQYFELRSYETDPPFAAHRWRVRVESIEFEEGPWVDKCDYTVTLVHMLEEDGPEDFSETWTLETNDDEFPCTYRLSHEVSAKFSEWWNSVGGDTDPGFERAMDWLKNHVSGYNGVTGINHDRVYAPAIYGFQLPLSYDAYNYTRSETIDEAGGNYSLSETWVLSEEPAQQTESITITKSSEENKVTASVEGTITPLKPAKDCDCTSTAAESLFNSNGLPTHAIVRAQTAVNFLGYVDENDDPVSLGDCVKSQTTTFNDADCSISYSYEFSDAEDVEETISVTVSTDRENCEKQTVSVSGTLQGYECVGETAWENVLDKWTTDYGSGTNVYDIANAYYTGSGTLGTTPVSTSVTYNESSNQLSFEYTYDDWPTNYTQDLTVTVAYSQDDCGIGTVTVEGTIKGLCDNTDDAWQNVQDQWTALEPTLLGIAQGYEPDANVLTRTSVSYNEFNKTISFSYEYSTRQENAIVEYTTEIADAFDTCLQTVTVSGSVKGYCTDPDNPESAYNNAVSVYNSDVAPNILTWAQNAYTGSGSLDTLPTRQSKGENKRTGTITFSFTYNDRPAKCLTNALTESINWQHQHPGDMFAIVPVLGRANGPVLQDKGTVKEMRSTLSIEATVCAVGSCDFLSDPAIKTDVDALVAAALANLQGSYTIVFKESDTESWNPATGRYSRNVTWVYGIC